MYNIILAATALLGSIVCIYVTTLTLKGMRENAALLSFYRYTSGISQFSFSTVSITYFLYFICVICGIDSVSWIPLIIAVLLSPVGSCTLVVFFIGRLYFTFNGTPYSISRNILKIFIYISIGGILIAETAVALYVFEYFVVSFVGIFVAILILNGMCITILNMFSSRLLKVEWS